MITGPETQARLERIGRLPASACEVITVARSTERLTS
jgi:hypothetical protein